MRKRKITSQVLAIFIIILLSGFSFDTEDSANFLRYSIHSVQAKELGELQPVGYLGQPKSQRTDIFPIHPGYPLNLDYWIEKSPPTIADINNDGKNELIVSTYDTGTGNPGKVYAFSNTGALLPGFPITTDGHIRGRLTVGDLNHDGTLEIAAGVDSFNPGIGAKVYIWRSNGTLLPGWPQQTACARADEYCDISSIVFSDIDGDGKPEVIAGTDNRDLTTENPSLYLPNLYVWRSDGQVASGAWPAEDDHNVALLGSIASGDFNGDGKNDIVTGRDYNRLFAYNGTGSFLPGWPVYVFWPFDSNNWNDDRISFARSAVTLADLDRDGTLEFIVNGLRVYANTSTFYNTDLLVYGANGKRWKNWSSSASGNGVLNPSTSYGMLEAPVIADINGDGFPDIVVATQDGWIRAYSYDKKLLWSFNYAQGQIIYATEPVIGDVNGDGWNEVLFGTYDIGHNSVGPYGVYILDHNGNLLPGTPLQIVEANPLGVSGGPTLGDLDGNGKIEIAATTYRGNIFVWDTPGLASPSHLPWPMARHDLQRTGLFANPIQSFGQSTLSANVNTAKVGNTVTYSLKITRSGPPSADVVYLTNVIPAGLSYIPGSMTANSGINVESAAPTLKWSGSFSTMSQVIITYQVKVVQASPEPIKNIATLDAGISGQYSLSSTIIINGTNQFLPVNQK